MNYSGDQGQTIRQLISAHVLRRVAMCVLSSPHGRRQHLAVSHEKGKVSLGLALVGQVGGGRESVSVSEVSVSPGDCALESLGRPARVLQAALLT